MAALSAFTRRDSISKLTSFGPSSVIPLTGCAMDWARNGILRVSKNSGLILSRVWTKVQEFLGRRRGPLVLYNAFVRLSIIMSCFIPKILR